ncbi:MAG: glutaredoxin [Nitrospiraceae bacterium]
MALILYHVQWCPECAVVRAKLKTLNLQYEDVIVPDFRPSRTQVFKVSGQYYVPVLKDGDTILTETHAILEYLDTHYATGKAMDKTDGEGEEFPSCSL